MFLNNKKNRKNNQRSQRTPKEQFDNSFRRNNVVVSKRERTIKEHQQSVTQRQQDRLKQQLRHMRRVRFLVLMSIIFIIFVFIKMRLTDVNINASKNYNLTNSQKSLYEESIKNKATNHATLNQSWLLDSEGFVREFKKSHPEVESIYIHAKSIFSSSTEVDIVFRTPHFVWKDVSGTSYFVDKNGVLFKINRLKGVNTTKMVHIDDQSGVTLSKSNSVLTKPLIKFIGQLPNQAIRVYGSKAKVEKVIIPQSIRELRFKISGQPYEVKLSTARSIHNQMGELKTLLNFLKGRSSPKSYIDLRVENKAFYK